MRSATMWTKKAKFVQSMQNVLFQVFAKEKTIETLKAKK